MIKFFTHMQVQRKKKNILFVIILHITLSYLSLSGSTSFLLLPSLSLNEISEKRNPENFAFGKTDLDAVEVASEDDRYLLQIINYKRPIYTSDFLKHLFLCQSLNHVSDVRWIYVLCTSLAWREKWIHAFLRDIDVY